LAVVCARTTLMTDHKSGRWFQAGYVKECVVFISSTKPKRWTRKFSVQLDQHKSNVWTTNLNAHLHLVTPEKRISRGPRQQGLN
jgi:hypothetical protein